MKQSYQDPFKHNYGFGPTTPPTKGVILYPPRPYRKPKPEQPKTEPKPKNQSLLETIVGMLIGFKINKLDTPRGRLYTKILALYKSSSSNS